MLADVMRSVDAVIDLMPLPLMREAVLGVAIETRTPLVTTNYARSIMDLAPAAEKAGIAVVTDAASIPVSTLCSTPARRGGSIPYRNRFLLRRHSQAEGADTAALLGKLEFRHGSDEPEPRPASLSRAAAVEVPLASNTRMRLSTRLRSMGSGMLGAYPNGDAPHYAAMLGATDKVAAHRPLRAAWPDAFSRWKAPLKQLGFLSEDPRVPGSPAWSLA